MSKWVATQPNPSAAARLLCFPYAGGAASIYRDWQAALPEVEVCPVLLPGRGARMAEPACSQLGPLVEVLAEALVPYLDRPFFFFGHSMGAMIAFELARAVRARGLGEPAHLFLSARGGPRLPQRGPAQLPQSDDEFLAQLRTLNGMGGSDSDELVRLMLPTLRADMTLVQTHRHLPLPPLHTGITVFGGTRDSAAREEDLLRWRFQTVGAFRLHLIDGDHFFINSHRPVVLESVSRVLGRVLREGGRSAPAAEAAQVGTGGIH
jgi:medium-chain acyl-[acyl-carrier-protein] hydrolase